MQRKSVPSLCHLRERVGADPARIVLRPLFLTSLFFHFFARSRLARSQDLLRSQRLAQIEANDLILLPEEG